MKDQLLPIELRLLILRYGRESVLEALALLTSVGIEEIEKKLSDIEKKPKLKRNNKSPSLLEIASSESRERPEIEEPLRALVVKFENKTFLPHLRDAVRFLERMGVSNGSIKSRNSIGPIVVSALSKLSVDDLVKLSARSDTKGQSDFSLLSRAIMGKAANAKNDK